MFCPKKIEVMADKKMSEFNTGNSANYIYAQDSGGNQIRITLSNLLGSNFQSYTEINNVNADDITTSGLYPIGSGVTNIPSGCAWSDLIVFTGYSTIQLTYNKTSYKVYMRIYSRGGSNKWSEWKELSFI